MRRRAVFLDRDGVLNRVVLRRGKPYPPAGVHEMEIPEDVPHALEQLRDAGFMRIVVTNQPDVARGSQARAAVEAIHAALAARLPLDAWYVSFDADDACPRRKPNPGMLLEAATDWNLDLQHCFMVGDRWKDVEAGRRAGCRTVFLDAGYTEQRPEPPADCTATTLSEAAAWILQPISCKEATHVNAA